ncbi:hypothetical protein ACET3Z_030872 [Daucus carota]
MKLKQKQLYRYVPPRSPTPPPSPLPSPSPSPPPSPVRHQSRVWSPPPPPPLPPILNDTDRTLIASRMVEVSCSSLGGTTSVIASRNWKRKADDTTICNIPRSLLHNIFLFIPALTLRSMTKRVCKEWNYIISNSNFVREHSTHNSSGGFLVQKRVHGKTSQSYFVEIRDDTNGVTIHPTNLVFETVIASSGGFLYIKESTETSKLSIMEPVSGKKLNLPPSPQPRASLLFSGFAQDRNTGIYKVVRLYSGPSDNFCFVLSLSVEHQWRPINGRSFYRRSSKSMTISAGRYVYWATRSGSCYFDIVTFDAETESIYYFPTTYVKIGYDYTLLRMEDSLSLMSCNRNYKWKVWKFNISNPRVWERICKIDLSGERLLIERELSKGDVFIKPIAWLRNGKLILFRLTYPSQCCIAYDVGKGDSFWFEFPDDGDTGKSVYFNISGIFSLNKP